MTDRDLRARTALEQAGRYFMGTADVQLAASRIAAKLEELGIPYAICGGLAVSAHGHVQTTANVDVLLTAEGLRRFKAVALGNGYAERASCSRGVGEVDRQVAIGFLLAGEAPDEAKVPGFRFPDPAAVAVEIGGKCYASLRSLIEMKLVGGLCRPDRPGDLADVIQLIRANALPETFASGLHPGVQAKYRELWGYAQLPTREF